MNGQDTFHVLAFGNLAAIGATDAQLNAIAEQPFNRDNANKFVVPDKLYLWGAYASGLNLIRARINTASRRIRGFPQIVPFNRALLPSTNDVPFMDCTEFPIPLEELENIEVDASNNNVATENEYVLLFVSRHLIPNETPPPLARWIRFTATPTAVAFGWSAPVILTPQDQLEGGHYLVWGMTAVEANGVATRLIWPRGTLYKPGCICNSVFGIKPPDAFIWPKWGHWGDFDTYAFPQVEHLGNVAGATTVEVMLLVSKEG
jgi:hypothetical protein